VQLLTFNTAGLIWGVTLVRDTRGTASKTVARVRRPEAKQRMTHAEAINSRHAARR
jgi:hypothetical protein